ncbi:M28 family peptidase [Mycobacterium marinum]|uniref:M28 family peptidase n=1 Tax=Mycobacterium marinum TaxID=1781 RepID=UPI00233FBBBF|nr:M28 family peptidase [Mycobacterium marinum]MDC8981096.1 M28 family peptidase [Mycobacterium marinum]MDC8995961.1 M28 family peptidase [Mycobacterium marinum]MDC9002086.1 M28 family peptidase [Mycobacterium marinum]MDC9012513.1 M28 family peptidase [Mycobacterium marinum]WDZ14682.1 M28 family peptidase [Mycobacterium marinum]
MIRATVQRFGATLVLACALAGCAAPKSLPPTAAPDLSRDLAAKVTGDGMFAHLRALQTVADSNGGNRATGTPGYDASVDYVVKALKAKGFEVTTPEFQRLYTVSEGKPTLTVAGRSYSVDQASLLVQTPPGGLAGPPVRPSRSDGCAVADYPPALPDNAIAVVDDTGCSVVDKHNSAVAKGAAGLIVISAAPDRGSSANLFGPGYYNQLEVPVAVVGASAAAALARTNAPIRLVLDTENIQIKSRNVLAQTKTGTPDEVVMVGARLDSPPGSPGINSAGSGVAAVLETALQLGPLPPVTNAVRFAFWGDGINGAMDYVFGMDSEGLNSIALYLNFDMLGSPNAGYFTDDGDQSGLPGTGVRSADVPEGSAAIERTLAGYLNLAGKRPADMPLSIRSDYHPFLVAGVPIGGMTTGASQTKTTVQARLWGGQAGVAFDPEYLSVGDTIDNINRQALEVMGSGVAFAVGAYAESIRGVNGVTPHDKRHRARVS